jgi:hypothetical protein
MKLSLEGEEATGKTTLAYTAPLPIVGFNFDLGVERAIYGAQYDELFSGLKIEVIPYKKGIKPPAWTGNDITIYELPMPLQLDAIKIRGVREQWDYFMLLFAEAIEDSTIRSLVVDTMTLARRSRADAYLQELQEAAPEKKRKQLLQIEWSHPNGDIRSLYNIAGNFKKNLVAIHHLTDERKDALDKDGSVVSLVTGQRILEGLGDTNRHIDISLRLRRTDKNTIEGTFLKCGYFLPLTGTPIANPTWNSIVELVKIPTGGRIALENR